jgi:hypothetical protein
MIDSTSFGVSLDSGSGRPDPLALDDPDRALRSALEAGLDPAILPEDIVLGWLLQLPATLDPADAAARVIAVSAAPVRNDRLLALLAEVANWPHHRLERLRGSERSRPQ